MQIVVEGEEAPLGDVCLTLTGETTYTICDNGEGDADVTVGSIELDAISPDEYAVAAEAPEGFEPVETNPATVTVEPGAVASLTLAFRPVAATPVEVVPGVLVFAVVLDDGTVSPVEICVDLIGPGSLSVCDNGEGDQDPGTGAIEVIDVVPGPYELIVSPPDGFEVIETQSSVEVPSGDVAQVLVTLRPSVTPTHESPVPTDTPTEEAPASGFVIASVLMEDGSPPIGGVCLTLTNTAEYQVCDDQDGDADPTTGVIEIDAIPVGEYAVSIVLPEGYELVQLSSESILVESGAFAQLEITVRATSIEVPTETPTEEATEEPTAEPTVEPTLTPTEEATPEPTVEPTEEPTPEPTPGSLVITKVSAGDDPVLLAGACFRLSGADESSVEGCDDDGDGVTRFDGLAAGEWTVTETQAPDNYAPGEDQTVTINEGEETTATVVNELLPPQVGTFVALTIDPDENSLAGACYTATGPDGAAVDGCDDDGDGRIEFGQVAVGDWTVRQIYPAPGSFPADPVEQPVTVNQDETTEVRFVSQLRPADQRELPPPSPKPSSVVATGDFQDELGCASDDDPTCDATALVDNRGVWSTVLPIQPGTYTMRLIGRNEAARLLGQEGQPLGPDLVVSVPEGTTGVYVEYNSLTGRIIASPRATQAVLVTNNGSINLAPRENGQFDGYVDVPAGLLSFQVVLNGEVVTEDQIELGEDSRIHIVVDRNGAVVTIEPVSTVSLVVSRFDANGNAVPGSCFALLTERGAIVGQFCDDDDQTMDGVTTLVFANGLTEGTYTLVETLSPEGAIPASEQSVDLVTGENVVDVVS